MLGIYCLEWSEETSSDAGQYYDTVSWGQLVKRQKSAGGGGHSELSKGVLLYDGAQRWPGVTRAYIWGECIACAMGFSYE